MSLHIVPVGVFKNGKRKSKVKIGSLYRYCPFLNYTGNKYIQPYYYNLDSQRMKKNSSYLEDYDCSKVKEKVDLRITNNKGRAIIDTDNEKVLGFETFDEIQENYSKDEVFEQFSRLDINDLNIGNIEYIEGTKKYEQEIIDFFEFLCPESGLNSIYKNLIRNLLLLDEDTNVIKNKPIMKTSRLKLSCPIFILNNYYTIDSPQFRGGFVGDFRERMGINVSYSINPTIDEIIDSLNDFTNVKKKDARDFLINMIDEHNLDSNFIDNLQNYMNSPHLFIQNKIDMSNSYPFIFKIDKNGINPDDLDVYEDITESEAFINSI